MNSDTATRKISAGKFELNFDVVLNKKLPQACVFIQLNTTQKDLINMLLERYALEKVSKVGVNANNHATNATVGPQCILVWCPDTKIVNNINSLLTYITRAKLPPTIARSVTGDYKLMINDMKPINITITGKCKGFLTALKTDATKIKNMTNFIQALKPATRDRIAGENPIEEASMGINFKDADPDLTMLYTSILVGNECCNISRKGDSFMMTLHGVGAKYRLLHLLQNKDLLQARVKAFLVQSGSMGSPSANDKGGVKYKAKVERIMLCQNTLMKIHARLRGFNLTEKPEETFRKVDSTAVGRVKLLKLL